MSPPRDGRDRRRVAAALVAVAALALLARLWNLGWRVAHQDEARVADWILHYMEVGAWQYRPIIHGPFLPHVNGVVFDLLGPSDFTMRLAVAVVGALLVVTPWLLRERLSQAEVVAASLFFAANPVLLYYSRFMRNDLLLAAFMFTAFGLFVRALDTGKARYLYAAALPFALAFTTKENALLYPVCWLGALALVLDGRLVLAKADEETTRWAVARSHARRVARAAWQYKLHLGAALAQGAVVLVAFYAPKPDLYEAFRNPSLLPGVLGEATLGSWNEFMGLWGSTGMQEHSYVAFLRHDLTVLGVGATALVVFSVLGFLYERYAEAEPRPVVEVCFYWGAFSVFGYPAVADISAAWTMINAIVPLAVPAAVGVALVYDRGRTAAAEGNAAGARAVALALLVTAAGTGAVAAQTTYANPQGPDNALVQYAQPAGEMQPTLQEIRDISASNDGVDVMFYGDEFHHPDDLTEKPQLNVTTGGYSGWYERLPLPWYFDRYDANVSSTLDNETIFEYSPPVVVALDDHDGAIDDALTERGYTRTVHQGYQHSRPLVFYVKENATA
ncbi:flippase activity-associated protein Agl23 [Halobacterium sp. CBA1126]|uniref:flippase activity-associated protein Agl23 n=1 Tax=Halobacterium sp. CBA1126 TaxID=2668074 RepID=UPI0012F98107|nr:flippase activity-associated protein Agl23 [Halobacterium sp. CBA1126]MUV60832.1 TIGR03663 family protein [Halobacterium sp. CBA1126]